MKLHQLRLPLRLSDTPYVVVDTETTGLDHEVDRLVEVAALRFERGRVIDTFETLVDPQRDIPAEASEQHHLVYEDVEGAPPFEAIEPNLDTFVGGDLVVAHNAPFDRGFLEVLEGREWLCSARAARHMWPDAPAHRNQFLRYWLALDAPKLRTAVAHRAAGDAHVTGLILHRALMEYEIVHPDAGLDDFVRHVASPVPISTLRFGQKHRGKPLGDVPTDYYRWMLGNVGDLDPDLRAAILAELERRAVGREIAA
jgi:exodeoxyribonuclease X